MLLGVGGGLGYLLVAVRVDPPQRELATLAPLVESIVVQAEDVVEHFVGYGTAQAMRSANLAAEVAATVVECVNGIRAGSPVSAGQALIRLDDRQYRHVLERVEARGDAEQASLDELTVEAENLDRLIKTAQQEARVAVDERTRVAGLLERKHAAKKEYDFANLAYQQARRVLQGYERELAKLAPRRARLAASKRGYDAEAALAQLDIERCEIKAPFGGRIHKLMVDVGDRVAPGFVVATLIDASRVEIAIQLPASKYDRVHVGAPCRVESDSLVGTNWRGEIVRIAPQADEQTRTFAVYVVVDNAELGGQVLVPGSFVRAAVRGPVHAGAILLPRSACRNGRVFVVENDIARERLITIERFMEDRAMVRGPLLSGDRVIVSHLDKLADGSPVRAGPVRSAGPNPLESSDSKVMDSSP